MWGRLARLMDALRACQSVLATLYLYLPAIRRLGALGCQSTVARFVVPMSDPSSLSNVSPAAMLLSRPPEPISAYHQLGSYHKGKWTVNVSAS